MAFSGNGSGTSGDPYQITTVEQLQEMQNELSAYYKLMNDIDASDTVTWNGGKGFTPVGTMTSEFTGQLNGNKKRVRGLTIDRRGESSVHHQGLFGYSNGIIEDLYLIDAVVYLDLSGGYAHACLVGTNRNMIRRCYVSGTLSGGENVGLICGRNQHYIENCISKGDVVGRWVVGGLVGLHYAGEILDCGAITDVTCSGTNNRIGGFCGLKTATIRRSYSAGHVINGGGFCGKDDGGSMVDCFWDTITSGQTTSDGGTGKTTSEMKALATYSGWEIESYADHTTEEWFLLEGKDYPYPGWYEPPYVKVYNSGAWVWGMVKAFISGSWIPKFIKYWDSEWKIK